MLIELLRTRLRPFRKLIAVVAALQASQAIAGLLLPTINADIIDNGVIPNDSGHIWSRGVLMLAVTLIQMGCAIAAVYVSARVSMAFGRDVRGALFHQVTGYSTREVGRFGAPSLITRITNDVQQVQMLVLMGCTMLIAPFSAIGGVVLALRQDVGLSAILMFSIPALLIGVGAIASQMVPQFRLMQDRIDTVNRVLREQLAGLRVIRAFVREPLETDRFAEANDALTETALRAGRLMAFMFPLVMVVMNLSSAGAIWIGADRIDSNELTVGALIAFLGYLIQILMAVMMTTFLVVMAPRAAVSGERIMEVLNTSSSVVAPEHPVTEVTERGTVEFRDVEFRYPGAEEPVLRGLSFTARAGQTTAIIGSTGAGKSTLLNLIPRLFDATAGSVLVNGVDVRSLEPQLLWSRLGLVPQSPYLFSGTLRSTLRTGDPDATDAALWAALDVAQGRHFVEAMPEGLDAPITQGGTNVSGGQRQRLAIARALLREPEIYLFDDSFSALDLATDARLREALAPVTESAAVIIVAQRVSTIRDADQILVVERGQIVGSGTHDELVDGCSTYREIVDSQLASDDVADPRGAR